LTKKVLVSFDVSRGKLYGTFYGGDKNSEVGVVLCPPHPLYGGSRNDFRLVKVAEKLAEKLREIDHIENVEIAGPGFINLWLDTDWLARSGTALIGDKRLGVERTENPSRVVVDYSSPNMAKQMHVGHLRSTIIGDTLANLFTFLGDEVIRQNHIGDWGTQFGMLIAYLEELGEDGSGSLSDLEQFYKDAKGRFDADEAFADRSREYVVKLQGGDVHCLPAGK